MELGYSFRLRGQGPRHLPGILIELDLELDLPPHDIGLLQLADIPSHATKPKQRHDSNTFSICFSNSNNIKDLINQGHQGPVLAL